LLSGTARWPSSASGRARGEHPGQGFTRHRRVGRVHVDAARPSLSTRLPDRALPCAGTRGSAPGAGPGHLVGPGC
jgi:hypothetical protein